MTIKGILRKAFSGKRGWITGFFLVGLVLQIVLYIWASTSGDPFFTLVCRSVLLAYLGGIIHVLTLVHSRLDYGEDDWGRLRRAVNVGAILTLCVIVAALVVVTIIDVLEVG